MSLAEELLADFEDDDGETLDDPLNEIKDEVIEEAMEAVPADAIYSSVYEVAKLADSEHYKKLVDKLRFELERQDEIKVTAPLEADPQYKLIVELSHLAADIDSEINVIHKFVRDKYEQRFPELETLVPLPLDYLAAVKLLGNEINTKGQNKELLGQILNASTCIVVSVTASTTQGKQLDPSTLSAVMDACNLAESLNTNRHAMYQLVENRMALIAPNLVKLLGAGTTALLVSQAGGLAPLSKMPACNIQVLGRQKRNLSGFSSATTNPHVGFIYYHPIVQELPPDLKSKAMKVLAAKATLAARVDSLHESPNGDIGRDLREQVEKKYEKMLEPPSVKAQKALPKPLDKASKKRGGRRARKTKERLGLTDYRKAANRMNFGELGEDVMQEHMGFDVGQAKSGSNMGGRIRAGVIDNKTRVRMSQKLQRQIERQKPQGGTTSIRTKTAGTMSSISFTPVQGLEIVNRAAIEKIAPTSSTYFSSSATFLKVATPKPL